MNSLRIFYVMKKPWHNRPGNIGLTVRQRLVEKIIVNPVSGCWEWQAAINKSGYGKFQIRSHHTSVAHRESYREFNGEITDGLFVCHKCDNKLCINPKHLWLGTHKENINDAQNKGRMPKVDHPSHNHYQYGCRCDKCKACQKIHARAMRIKYQKIPTPVKPPINQYDANGNFIAWFPSVIEASKTLGLDNSSIHKVLHGKANKCRGFIFKYAT